MPQAPRAAPTGSMLGSTEATTLIHDGVVRASPTDHAQIIASLPAGTAVTVASAAIHNKSGDWYFVKNASVTGWINVLALQP
ncbi:SH3 domain-containing protein [Solimonas terrae]|nr:SH3 domain-containing protein [Solimonas terrae]